MQRPVDFWPTQLGFWFTKHIQNSIHPFPSNRKQAARVDPKWDLRSLFSRVLTTCTTRALTKATTSPKTYIRRCSSPPTTIHHIDRSRREAVMCFEAGTNFWISLVNNKSIASSMKTTMNVFGFPVLHEINKCNEVVEDNTFISTVALTTVTAALAASCTDGFVVSSVHISFRLLVSLCKPHDEHSVLPVD